jgi:hypothetical protein
MEGIVYPSVRPNLPGLATVNMFHVVRKHRGAYIVLLQYTTHSTSKGNITTEWCGSSERICSRMYSDLSY